MSVHRKGVYPPLVLYSLSFTRTNKTEDQKTGNLPSGLLCIGRSLRHKFRENKEQNSTKFVYVIFPQ